LADLFFERKLSDSRSFDDVRQIVKRSRFRFFVVVLKKKRAKLKFLARNSISWREIHFLAQNTYLWRATEFFVQNSNFWREIQTVAAKLKNFGAKF
jgi:hypothetical protein